MGDFKSLSDAREFFRGDIFAANSGIVIDEIAEDMCICSMEITDNHKNAAGGVMGGAIFTLADFAFATLANNLHKMTVVQNASINFFSSVREGRLIARATCKKNGKTTCVCNVEITDGQGRDIAQYVGTGYKL